MKSMSLCAAILLLLLQASLVHAQITLKWNEDKLDWTAPAQCEDGSPIADCPITGYRIETATSTTGAFATVATVGNVLTHKLTGLSPGPHCYRVLALAGATASKPSNVACATATSPPPGAPVLQTVDQVAWDVKRRYWGLFGPYELNAMVGTVELGTECNRDSVEGHNGVSRDAVTFYRKPRSKLIVARCA